MNGCEQLHRLLEAKPLIRYPYAPDALPQNAVYFMYEDAQTWGHGRDEPRIVQVGTHKDGNLAPRLAEQFLLSERKMDFGVENAAPKDRSILRKSIGRAFLNKADDPYLPVWNLDLTERAARDRFASLRNIEKEKEIESAVTGYMRASFSFRIIEIPAESARLGESSITRRIIATLASATDVLQRPTGWEITRRISAYADSDYGKCSTRGVPYWRPMTSSSSVRAWVLEPSHSGLQTAPISILL